MENIIQFLNIDSILQIVMLLFTFLYSIYILECNKVAFIYGTISSIITAYVFISSGVYVQGALFIIYAIIYMCSYYKWKNEVEEVFPRNISFPEFMRSILFFVSISSVMCIIFMKTSEFFVIDSITASLSKLGVFWLDRKIIENAHFFILSNVGSMIVCVLTNSVITFITFIIYIVFNIVRIVDWNKLKKRGEKIESEKCNK